ncbi:MAG: transcription-repair coupling factor [Gammaproteobacteria bacterium]|nr:transcription-repair coupling factor [Gammaproteobacteria bacterium]
MSESLAISPLHSELPVTAGECHYWGRLYGSSKALALSAAAVNARGPLVIITADLNNATRLLQGLAFYQPRPGGEFKPLSFPDWETLPYDLFSPYQDIISDRLASLSHLPNLEQGILVVAVTTVMHRLLPRSYLSAYSLSLKVGQELRIDPFRAELTSSGYRFVSQVMEHGDVAVRGSILDIFPMGSREPYRIDLFAETIDSIRLFDPETQRSKDQIQELRILPARETALLPENIARFRANWRTRFEGNPATVPVYKDVSDGIAPAGIEYYLPLFYTETSSLFDYLHGNAVVVLDEGVEAAAETFWGEINDRYEQGRHNRERPLLAPEELFYRPEDLLAQISRLPRIQVSGLAQDDTQPGRVNFACQLPPQLPVDARASEPLAPLRQFIGGFGGRILLLAESAGRRETILELLAKYDLRPTLVSDWQDFLQAPAALALTVAPLQQGAMLLQPRLAVVCEAQLFGERVEQRRLRKRRQFDTEALVRNLTELTIGAPVVHMDHGVGRYRGLVTLVTDGIPAEYLLLEYDQGDKLYVPVASLDLIGRYTGVDPDHAPLHRLGSGQWQKARRRAAEKVHDVAAELLELHARRAARSGYSFSVDADAYRAYAQSFPFEETPGQEEAIHQVIRDMADAKPMDRLICGDSGFGKTEVAMRAAFIAVQSNKQVALLVPTTLLAQQHYQNFQDRFADWPVRIEMLSRFRSKNERDIIQHGLQEGTIDIVIGTHKLLQGDIHFRRLGLVIIDEEHRFGVRQKEQFKSLRAEVDVLTMTATPIPRTLNMALADIRDLSIIATPPSRRLPVKTFIREWNDAMVKEALLREIKRGGQVYFLHNKIEDIEARALELAGLLPEARVRVAHGQMPEKELERVMQDFYHQRFNVLVCTTIIETGIDVPNANTIFINRADKFGLAQLYQLRGRVGRSHHRAYAYLIVPPVKAITADAVKRLEAIEALEELGIGFTLATHDLEIRGAGEILGEEQSGQIQEVGYGLYMEMLDRAVRSLQAGKQPLLDRPLDHGTEINLHVPALIPEDYLPDVHARLILYKRIAGARDDAELQDLQEEMIDRFGLPPEPLKTLWQLALLKLKALPLGVSKIDVGANGGRIIFHEQTNIDPVRVIKLIQSQPAVYKLDGQSKLKILKDLPDTPSRIKVLHELLDFIAIPKAA